jgi:hypothetical protein
MRAADAPASCAASVETMVSWVQLVPVAATTGARPAEVSTAIRIKRSRSFGERAGPSPVTPHTTKPGQPCSICNSMSLAKHFSSTSSPMKGVGSAVNDV